MIRSVEQRSIIALLLVGLSLGAVDSTVVSGVYKALNEYLLSHVSSREPADYIAAARTFLSSLPDKEDDEKVGPLRAFIALDQINDENICSYESYLILTRLLEVTYREFTYPFSHESRIDAVINSIRDKRSERCYGRYEKMYAELEDKFAGSQMATINRLVGKLEEEYDYDELSDTISEQFMSSSDTFIKPYIADVVGDGNSEAGRLEELLVNPCKEYLREMGPLDRQEYFDRQSCGAQEPTFASKESWRLLVCEYLEHLPKFMTSS